MYNILIKNGAVIDGTASPALRADVAVKDGKIVKIARDIVGEADRVIDAAGRVVTPGFIDSHSHSDSAVKSNPAQIEKVEQGITTSIAGQCGDSPMPMAEFLTETKDIPQGANIAVYVGHSSLRSYVMGGDDREPTPEELSRMKELLREGIKAGAMGISFGLIYLPGMFAKTDELIELAKVAAQCGGLVTAHIRNEGDRLLAAVEEFIEIIRASGARGIISHHKSAGRENWGKVSETLRMIDAANAEGLEIYCDVYPYIASHTSLSPTFIVREYADGGFSAILERLGNADCRAKMKEALLTRRNGNDDFSYIMIVRCPAYPQYEGKRLNEIAAIHGKDQIDTAFDLMYDSKSSCGACFFTMREEDVEMVLAHPRAMIATDSGIAGTRSHYHPRLRGTFPRILGRYVRERGVTTLPEMIRKMTSLPAAVYGLQSKGLLREGMDADICIFDADTIIDRADYTNCHLRAEGLDYVIVGGQIAAENAVATGVLAGKVLLRD